MCFSCIIELQHRILLSATHEINIDLPITTEKKIKQVYYIATNESDSLYCVDSNELFLSIFMVDLLYTICADALSSFYWVMY